jgi:hypothetical protein
VCGGQSSSQWRGISRRRRHPPNPSLVIRERLHAAGFEETMTEVAQHIPATVPFAVAIERGVIDRHATSQLMVLSDAEYDEGLARLRAEQPILHADLRLYATFGGAK